MSKIEAFFKENNTRPETVEYIASTRFTGADGKPIPWKLRRVPTHQI